MSYVARNHPQQVGKRGADDTTDDRRTPPKLLAECMELAEVEAFDHDVAATKENTVAPRWWSKCDHDGDHDLCADGLNGMWVGRVWCNPPYSDIRPWVEKAWEEYRGGERDSPIVMLLPANRTEQAWWQDLIEPARRSGELEVYFLRGRRRFDRPGWVKPKKGDRPPFGLCVIVWGANE